MNKNGITIRNYTPDDKAALLAISVAADEVDRVERLMTAQELDEWLTIPGVQPCRDFFLAEVEGQPVGYAGFDVQTGSLERHTAFCEGQVHPSYRHQGVGTALMRAVEARAAEVMDGLPPGLERHFESFCRSTQTGVTALLRSRDMEPVRYFLTMQRRLEGDLPRNDVNGGLVIRPYRDEDDDKAREAFDEAFRDHWGYEPVSEADWHHFLRDVPHFRPELWFLAWDGDEVAGFTFNFVDPSHIQQAGRLEGTVGEVGVRRPWRRRGVATALLAYSLRALQQAGMEWAHLGVDSQNPNEAVTLYERVGFVTKWQNVVYKKNI
jgi:mycothiol synthase